MAFITSSFYSAKLAQEVEIDLYLPNDYTSKTGIIEPKAIIYFLHGLGRNYKYFKELFLSEDIGIQKPDLRFFDYCYSNCCYS